jgi:hypothetical protein
MAKGIRRGCTDDVDPVELRASKARRRRRPVGDSGNRDLVLTEKRRATIALSGTYDDAHGYFLPVTGVSFRSNKSGTKKLGRAAAKNRFLLGPLLISTRFELEAFATFRQGGLWIARVMAGENFDPDRPPTGRTFAQAGFRTEELTKPTGFRGKFLGHGAENLGRRLPPQGTTIANLQSNQIVLGMMVRVRAEILLAVWIEDPARMTRRQNHKTSTMRGKK